MQGKGCNPARLKCTRCWVKYTVSLNFQLFCQLKFSSVWLRGRGVEDNFQWAFADSSEALNGDLSSQVTDLTTKRVNPKQEEPSLFGICLPGWSLCLGGRFKVHHQKNILSRRRVGAAWCGESTKLNGALTTYSANDNFASRFVVDISDCKARLAKEYRLYPKCVHDADANANLFAN